MAITVGLLDDNEMWRNSLELSLEHGGFEVVVSSERPETFYAEIQVKTPDVALIDLRMPPTMTDEGIVVADHLRTTYPQMGLIILSGYEEPLRHYYVQQALNRIRPGPLGCLYKDRVTPRSLYVDVHRVASGKSVVDSVLATEMVSAVRERAAFKEVELEVLELMVAGWTNRQIAPKMSMSIATVDRHVAEIFRKLLGPGDAGGSDLGRETPSSLGENKRVLAVVEWLRRTERTI